MLLAAVAMAVVPLSAQAPAGTPLDALWNVPFPEPMLIRPRVYAAYGALIGAALLALLYLYRGRPFIVYWIGGWLLTAASLGARSVGFDDPRVSSVVQSVSSLFGLWASGLFYLAPAAFRGHRVRWTTPLKAAAATAVWFVVSPFAVPLGAVLATGYLASTVLLALAAVRYVRLGRATRYVGAFTVGIGMLAVALSNLSAAALMVNSMLDVKHFGTILGLNIVMNIFVALGMHVVVFEDMTAELRRTNQELEAANEEVRRLAITDPLTGCYNRRFFDQIERREIQRHRRYHSALSVVFVDVDRFKALNDTLGHDTGDSALRAIGALLRSNVRESDYVIRWGGDEFVLLLTCAIDQAKRKASELKVAFDCDPQTAQLPGGIGLSIGVAEVPPDAESLGATIKLADTLMYRDKSGRVGRVGPVGRVGRVGRVGQAGPVEPA